MKKEPGSRFFSRKWLLAVVSIAVAGLFVILKIDVPMWFRDLLIGINLAYGGANAAVHFANRKLTPVTPAPAKRRRRKKKGASNGEAQ